MKSTATAVTDDALKLNLQERASLAHKLILSLDEKPEPQSKAEWMEVIERRSREIDDGTVVCRSAEEVFADLQKKRIARNKTK
jgi:putative addiction module component (TIGR02574 family)